MEFSVTGHGGLPDDAILSIRAGQVRRQAVLSSGRGLKFSSVKVGEPVRIDVLQPVGLGYLVLKPGSKQYKVSFKKAGGDNVGNNVSAGNQSANGLQADMSCELQVKFLPESVAPGGGVGEPPLEPVDISGSPEKSDNASAMANARNYLESTQILKVVQAMLQTIIQERPIDPFSHMAKHLLSGYDHVKAADPDIQPQPQLTTAAVDTVVTPAPVQTRVATAAEVPEIEKIPATISPSAPSTKDEAMLTADESKSAEEPVAVAGAPQVADPPETVESQAVVDTRTSPEVPPEVDQPHARNVDVLPPVQEPVEVPAEPPVEASMEMPLEAAIDTAGEIQREPPTEAPDDVGQPPAVSGKVPSATQVPEEARAELPTEVSAEVPAEVPVDAPIETLAPPKGPTEGSLEVPTEAAVDASAEALTEIVSDVPAAEPRKVAVEPSPELPVPATRLTECAAELPAEASAAPASEAALQDAARVASPLEVDLPSLRDAIRETLSQSFENGTLADALHEASACGSNVPSSARPSHTQVDDLRTHIREAITVSVASGALANACQQLVAPVGGRGCSIEDIRAVQERFTEAMKDGRLATVLAEVLRSDIANGVASPLEQQQQTTNAAAAAAPLPTPPAPSMPQKVPVPPASPPPKGRPGRSCLTDAPNSSQSKNDASSELEAFQARVKQALSQGCVSGALREAQLALVAEKHSDDNKAALTTIASSETHCEDVRVKAQEFLVSLDVVTLMRAFSSSDTSNDVADADEVVAAAAAGAGDAAVTNTAEEPEDERLRLKAKGFLEALDTDTLANILKTSSADISIGNGAVGDVPIETSGRHVSLDQSRDIMRMALEEALRDNQRLSLAVEAACQQVQS